MPRTFSLKRLLLGITFFGVLFGLIANLPESAFYVAWYLGFFLPAMILSVLLPIASARRRLTAVMGLIGGIVGSYAMPAVIMAVASSGSRPTNLWDYYVGYYLIATIPPALGVFLLGGAMVLKYPRW